MEKNEKATPRNILEYAARKQAAFSAAIEDLGGYKPFTTFYGDLTIAEAYGLDAIRETCARVTKEWAGNYKYFTEFVLSLNWKIWEHHGKNNEELARLYNDEWIKADELAAQWTGEAAEWYYKVTD